MKIIKQEIISKPGEGANEDRAACAENFCWVLDGASGLGSDKILSDKSEVIWFVDNWNEYILKVSNSKTIQSLSSIIDQGISDIKEKFYKYSNTAKINDLNKPSSSIAIIKLDNNTLNYFILGDCTLLIKQNEDIISLKDNKLDKLDKKVIDYITQKINEENLTFKQARKKAKNLLIENRMKKNSKNGYWTLEFDNNAVENSLRGSVKLNNNTEILLMTDGFSAITDTYNLYDKAALFHKIKKEGLIPVYEELRKIEKSDYEAKKFPRLKVSDDASAVYCELA